MIRVVKYAAARAHYTALELKAALNAKETTQHLLCCDQKSSLLHKTAQESTSFRRIFILPNDNISNENISLAYCANS